MRIWNDSSIVGYLIKYVASPPIALYRITGYDGEYVRYWYREHPTDRQVFSKVSAYEFISMLIEQIPAKGLKLIRHYGLYARNKLKKAKEIINKIFRHVKDIYQGFFFPKSALVSDYRSRLENSFGVDPFKCPKCGNELILYEVWHPKHGIIYSIFRDENWKELEIKDMVEEEPSKEQRLFRQDSQFCLKCRYQINVPKEGIDQFKPGGREYHVDGQSYLHCPKCGEMIEIK